MSRICSFSDFLQVSDSPGGHGRQRRRTSGCVKRAKLCFKSWVCFSACSATKICVSPLRHSCRAVWGHSRQELTSQKPPQSHSESRISNICSHKASSGECLSLHLPSWQNPQFVLLWQPWESWNLTENEQCYTCLLWLWNLTLLAPLKLKLLAYEYQQVKITPKNAILGTPLERREL